MTANKNQFPIQMCKVLKILFSIMFKVRYNMKIPNLTKLRNKTPTLNPMYC